VLSGDRVGTLLSRGYNGTVYPEVAHTRVYATENFTGVQTGTRIEHSITRAGETNTHPYFDLSSTGLKIGDIDGAVSYTLPVARGTNNQVLKTDGAGVATWQDDTHSFDQSLNTTDDVKFNSVDTSLIDTAGELRFKSGTGTFAMGDAGGSDAGLILQTDNAGLPDFGFNIGGSDSMRLCSTSTLNGFFRNGGGSATMSWTSAGHNFNNDVTIDNGLTLGSGVPATQYTFPSTRGALNQVLKTNGVGVVTWQNDNPFDQSLNTTDVVEFKGVDTRSTAETGGVILGQFNNTSFWAHQDNIGGPILQLNKSRGTKSVPSAVLSGDRVGTLLSRGFNGSIYPEVAHTRVYATENFTGVQTGTRLEHSITRAGETNTHPYFDLSSTGLKIGDIDGSVDYTLPVARGTLNQILKTDGAGVASWQSDNPFDQDLNTTNNVSFLSMTAGSSDINMTLNTSGVNVYKKYSNTVNGPILETRRGRGTNAARLPLLLNDTLAEYVNRGYNGSGEVVASAIVSRATQNWSFGNTGSRMEIRITPTGSGLSVPFLDLKDDGLDIGNITAGTQYTLPTTRGTDGQILKTDGTGGVTWQENMPYQAMSTGVLEGGSLSVNVDDTKFDISDGCGQITQGAIKTPVTWSGLTGQSFIYAGLRTYVLINSSGTPVSSATLPTNAQMRDNIYLGLIIHVNAVNISSVVNEPVVIANIANQYRDLGNAIGYINTGGNQIMNSGNANLTWKKSSGTLFRMGSNWDTDVKDPNNHAIPLLDTSAGGIFRYAYQDSSVSAPTQTVIIPNEYDNGNGILIPGVVNNNDWQVQRFYMNINGFVVIQPGQQVYNSYGEAIASYQTENFTTADALNEAILIGWLFVRGGAVNLLLETDGVFVNAGKFGGSASGGSSGSGITRAHAQQYFLSNTLETAIGLTDTYYDITGTRLDSELNEFSAQAQSLTYTGTTSRTLKLETHFSWQGPAGASAENYRAAFFKNGSLIVPGQMTGALQVGGNYPRNMSSSAIVSAIQNDVFTVRVKNVTATQNVVIKDFQFILSDI
jgi:hypothetical protein